MFVHGLYHLRERRAACRNDHCMTCGAARFFLGMRSIRFYHVFFIPLLPVGWRMRYLCTICGADRKARRPSHPLVLWFGVFAGGVIAFVGLMMLLSGEEVFASWMIFGIGAVFFAVIGFMVRRSEHREFMAAVKSVEPLPCDSCPLCHQVLAPSIKPQCHGCRITIITTIPGIERTWSRE
jgi:hypothetical protein